MNSMTPSVFKKNNKKNPLMSCVVAYERMKMKQEDNTGQEKQKDINMCVLQRAGLVCLTCSQHCPDWKLTASQSFS